MSAATIRRAVQRVACDADVQPPCPIAFDAEVRITGGGREIRRQAADAGWKVRPPSGKGSRSAPDLCPGHNVSEAR